MDESRAYMRRIMMAVNIMEGLYVKGAQKSHTTDTIIYLLYALGDGKPHTQKSIHERWLIPRTTLNTAVKKCEAAGYITLEPVPGCKRDLQICLTEAGRQYEQQVMGDLYAAEERAVKKTLQACGAAFIDDLELFCENLRYEFEADECSAKAAKS